MNENGMFPIRARSHLLKLLGEELIGDDRLAVFELVKNSYDADAGEVVITLNLLGNAEDSIVVQDTGTGMTLDDIAGKWLELATDSRRSKSNVRTKIHRRLSLGGKGVGRIAAFKIGRFVTMTTRVLGQPEYEVQIDWDQLLGSGNYIENMSVPVVENSEPKFFRDQSTGTRIQISGLRREKWSRGDIRSLYRLVSSLASPFKTPDRFNVLVSVPGREIELKDLIDSNDFLDLAVWKFNFRIYGKLFDWKYEFNPPHWKSVSPRVIEKSNDRLALTPISNIESNGKSNSDVGEGLLLTSTDLDGIGDLEGCIYAYYKRSEVLNSTGNSKLLKLWLDDQTGVRVYRDGIRVFTYGERNDDWLGLNARRINTPSGKLGTNSVISAIHLHLEKSTALKEKTNREGFDQNEAFEKLRRIVLSVFEHMERLHADDRTSLDNAIKGNTNERPLRFVQAMENLRAGLKTKRLDQSFSKDVDAIEREFVQLRDVMTNAGMAGINLAVIFHEIEREVESLSASLERGLDSKRIRQQIEHLHQLLQGFAPLLRKNSIRTVFVSGLIKAALMTREPRFRHHKVVISSPILEKAEQDFKISGVANLITGALGNLLDNALYWSRIRKERDEHLFPASVFVTTNWDDNSNSGMIAVVDNGPGFSIPIDRAAEAFLTTRPGGMGLGLYFAKHVMELCGGELTIHAAQDLRDEISIPEMFDGAAIALRFRESN